MKKLSLWLLAFLPVFGYAQKNGETLWLNEGWTFSQTGKDTWYEAQVPGSVQHDLIRHKVLPDPFYGTNERLVQWVEDENWDFKKTFTVSAEQLRHDDAVIFFEGLDTQADVFLNGARILRSENMFVGYKISVKNILKEGENSLYIRFYSPVQSLMPARLTAGYDYPAGNDHRDEKLSIYNRKAPYQFGWDWGIRIAQMGIWKPVSLVFYDKVRIDDFFVKQTSVTAQSAKIENIVEVFSIAEKPVSATVTVEYAAAGEAKRSVSKQVTLHRGNNTVFLELEIAYPKRWMPTGWGDQHLYDFTANVAAENRVITEKTEKIGLRSVRLVQEPDKYGKSFYFEVNGIPLFAKGANYIPGEIFTTQQNEDYYTKLFDNIEAANMNFVRVWGGGIYENEEFYRQADKRGILVWQDFIFGCVPYPSDDRFLANVKDEVIYNLKRLRNRASLAFWCGNNEVEEGLQHWGWDKQYPADIYNVWLEGYDKTFRELIPGLVNEFDGTRSYIHGSPYDSNWGNPETFASSDVHDWGLWYGHLPFEGMAGRLPRFASEFGFQSFPEMKTIRSFSPENEWSLESEVMKVHQKASTGNSLIKKYMDMYYHEPRNFEDFVYIGLVMQGNGMEESVEAMRRGRPYCMGALYWQINDDWPVVSWSSIDYYGNWKAQHYRMRDVLAPLALGVEFKDNQLNYYTLSDFLIDRNGLQLTVQVVDFNKGVVKQFKEKVNAKANSSNVVKTFNVEELLSEADKSNRMIRAWLTDSKGKKLSVKDHFFYWPNKLNLPQTTVQTSVKYADGKYTVTLTSKKLAKDVFIEIPVMGAKFTDNFIDLLPGEKKVIEITSPELKASAKTPVTVRHIRETY
ncbi:MAG: glycoside hydrolase family 2 protein [Petrimonas sp.]|jgi:beta-mannosidase|uniref:beta-mannosidase n=1 Tax=Petrimonas sp. TaxID=2023866 RepID=UPI000ECA0C2D|nr:glycoside hydrolase family 2 protein [Petrimonas sp.]HCF82060.1 beta-mannosidase [Porphyromonadaceae bacterium]MDD2911236.1 glycoside hydrolase family 2 protein [Petrimonas sp.]MDD4536220.1 glycoside hydrolase family 2 protein [Petrimonas sp.]MDX9774398.1 glycoside hydrolase family 2 protein [Petrimonas sp.]